MAAHAGAAHAVEAYIVAEHAAGTHVVGAHVLVAHAVAEHAVAAHAVIDHAVTAHQWKHISSSPSSGKACNVSSCSGSIHGCSMCCGIASSGYPSSGSI